jgi:hypothetical protein
MAKKIHPSAAMVADLKTVFTKHNWSGQPIGLVQPKAIVGGSADTGDPDGGDDPDNCPQGTSPQTVSYRLPNGDEVTKVICV